MNQVTTALGLGVLALLLIGGVPALAQDADEPPPDNPPAQDAEQSGDGDDDEAIDASDDIFLPSEEIQADSEISFPSDI